MAKKKIIGLISVGMSLDSAEFSKGINRAKKKSADFSANLKKTFAIGAAAATAALAGIGVALRANIKDMDAMVKAASKLGVAVEELSRLRYAADLSGVSFEKLSTGLSIFSKNMADTARGTGEARVAFQALGIGVANADGSLKSATEVMDQVADRFSRMPDGVEKTALAMRIFGESGKELIPMLNAGADGMAKMRAEADSLGIVIDEKTARKAEAFNDNLTRLSGVVSGLGQRITADLLPYLESFTNWLVANGPKIQGFVVGAVDFMAKGISKIGQAFEFILPLFDQFLARLGVVTGTGAARLKVLSDRFQKEMSAMQKAESRLANMRNKVGRLATLRKINIRAEIADRQKNIAAIESEINTINAKNALLAGQTPKPVTAASSTSFVPMRLPSSSVASSTPSVATQAPSAPKPLGDMLGGARLRSKFVPPIDQMQVEIDRARDRFSTAFAGGLMDAVQGGNWKQTLANSLRNVAMRGLENALQRLGGALFDRIGGSSGIAGGVFGGLGKLMGFANGGSFMVGGAGGVDSQLVAFKASPNERVSVTKPGQSVGGGNPVTVSFSPVIDARGADAAAVARLERALQDQMRAMPDMVRGAVQSATRRGAMT